jgi:hypothetical protein
MKTEGTKMWGKFEATCKSLKIDREEMGRSLVPWSRPERKKRAAPGMNYPHRIVQWLKIRGARKKSMAGANPELPAGVLADSHFETSSQKESICPEKIGE